jgi:hypothetical protein
MEHINNFTLNTTDYIFDLTYRNLSQFALIYNYRDTVEKSLFL